MQNKKGKITAMFLSSVLACTAMVSAITGTQVNGAYTKSTEWETQSVVTTASGKEIRTNTLHADTSIETSQGSSAPTIGDELVLKAKEAGIDVCLMSKGDSIEINAASGSRNTAKEETDGVMCLYPGTADTASDRNDMCLVLKFTDGAFSGIFGGDIPAEVEKELVAEYGKELSVDFYKANHHGSKYSGSKEWIEALSPRWAAVSCAVENRYGHPADEAMERLIDAKCRVFYTMQSGQIKYKESAIYENNRQ